MFDAIVNNIFILLPIAIFIALRILEARKKREEIHRQAEAKKSISGMFEEKEEVSRKEFYPQTERHNVPVPKKRPASSKPVKKTLVETLLTSNIEKAEAPSAATAKTASAQKQSESGAQGEKNFFNSIKSLSPMQKAIVMSEILGPPKGI